MLQLLRSTPRKNTDDIALDALFNQHDLTTRLSDNYRWMSRLNDFSAGLHQRIRTSLGAAVGIASHAPQLARIAAANQQSGQTLAQSSELIASASAPLTAEEADTSRGMTGTNPLTPQQCANRILSAVLPEVLASQSP